jgi:hypothetical protein
MRRTRGSRKPARQFGSAGAAVYSSSGYGSTATASTETIPSGPTVRDVFERVASANVRFSPRLRIIRRLGQQRDVERFHNAKPNAVTPHLTLLEADPAKPAAWVSTSRRAEYGALMEPSRRNQWQSAANRSAAETGETSQIRCCALPSVA